MQDNISLGQRLYELRKEKGLSQEKMAEELGVTRQTVSKWETDQSTPDFDKILPICTLFGISTQELITGSSDNSGKNDYHSSMYSDNMLNTDTNETFQESDYETRYNKYRLRFAVLTAVAVCLYIMSVIPFFIFESSSLMLSMFFVIIAVATMLIIIGAMTKPKKPEKYKAVTKEEKLKKQIASVMSGITLAVYLFVSFITSAWHITWIIWVIYGIACEILNLIFTLKGIDTND